MKRIIDLYPEAPCVWLWRDGEPEVKREFYPSVTIRMEDEPLWHECEERYRVGYDLLWEIRQVEHAEEELAELQAQYDAWKEANPDLVDEIEVSVPIKPEQNAEENEGE